MRKFAYEHGKALIPRMGGFGSLHEALDLSASDCSVPVSGEEPAKAATFEIPPHAVLVTPGESIQAAINLATSKVAEIPGAKPVVLLREGTHYLEETLMITPDHSGLTLSSYPGEEAQVSGGKALDVKWTSYNTSGGANIWVADVSGQVDDIPGLQLDGARATRARYPNLPGQSFFILHFFIIRFSSLLTPHSSGGIEVSCGYGCMVASNQAKWTPPNFGRFGNVTFYTDEYPEHDRNDTADDWFHHYMIGVNGLCSVYDPPVSYWCSEKPSGGGAFAFRTPSGVTPNTGYLPNLLKWEHPEDALWFVWRPARWANWMFETATAEKVSDSYNFTFGLGGNQGARGSNQGGDFFVENVFEELDNPGEFYFDKRAGKLYLWHNGTGAPSENTVVVAPQKQVLVNMTGTQWNPITDVNLKNIKYTASSYTYMMPHGVPSAGDWALDRYGAIFLQGTEGAQITDCQFERLDGNAVMISGYNRNATVTGSDFAYIGGNAIASWGYTNETSTDPGRPGVAIENAPQAGVDGTDGNHPRYNTIIGNTVREVGLYEKQSSFYVQAKTAESYIHGNVFFNGPRAGINANDGFGGGDEISYNLVFSSCRESGDHGPFNSWDRQPFLTTVRDGTPSMTMQWREIHHNFFIDNYSPQENVDNDDGSAYYKTHDNFLVYGGNGMKNDFGGHDNHVTDNIYAYAGQAVGASIDMLKGHEDIFQGNKAVVTGSSVGGQDCTGDDKTQMGSNSYFTQAGTIQECGKDLADWQKAGNDPASTVAKWPADETIIGWAKAKLALN